MRDMIVLINLDSGACRSMARKLRAEHIYCKILPAQATAEDVKAQDALGLLLAGADCGEAVDIPHLDELMQCGLPVMAMGDAALTLCEKLGGTLGPKAEESGVVEVYFEGRDPVLTGVESGERYFPALRSMTLPEDAALPLAFTGSDMLGFRMKGTHVYGMAFLPEQNDQDAMQLLMNYCRNVCGCTPWWSNQAFLDRAQEEIREAAGDAEAICALSGGVDSGVCAILGHMALGHKLHGLFVDTGLLRKDEGNQVMSFYQDQMGLNMTRINAAPEFLAALKGVTDPAEKEQIIFTLLRQIMAREVAARPGVKLMLKGTNYVDALERDTSVDKVDTIPVIEPVRELFKDEIRRVGEDLQLPPAIINRQPFPGSGLALRIAGEVTEEKLTVLRDADAIFRTELETDRQAKRLYQYYAMLADAPFGQGYAVILRAVQVIEGNTFVAARPPHDLLERIADRIREAQPQVVSITYDLTP